MSKLVNGTTYEATTPAGVIAALESARISGQRVRIFYGDAVTGCTWNAENDVTGTIGRSTGAQKAALLINNARSTGGGAILTACIVHMIDVKTKRVLYTHKLFKMPQAQIVDSTAACWPRSQPAQYTHAVKLDGVLHAYFTSRVSAARYAAFMTGLRGAK